MCAGRGAELGGPGDHLDPHRGAGAAGRGRRPAHAGHADAAGQRGGRGADGGDPGGEPGRARHVRGQQVRDVAVRRRQHDGHLRGQRPRHHLPGPLLPRQRNPRRHPRPQDWRQAGDRVPDDDDDDDDYNE